MAVTRSTICRKGIESLPRGGAIIYYVCVFLYFWVLSTPVVSLVFGSYLYLCINWFHIHFDEAFSSLRIAYYKAFTRFHIKKNGDLEVFTLAVDKVRSSLTSIFFTKKQLCCHSVETIQFCNEPGAKGLDAGSRLGHGTQAAIPDELHQEVPKQMEGRLRPGPNQCGAHC
jgi:hypothetical protein